MDVADLHAELLARLRAEREAQSGRPLWPAPDAGDDAGVMFPWLCAVVEAQGEAIEELRAERDALVARVEALEAPPQTAGEWLVQVLREEGEE